MGLFLEQPRGGDSITSCVDQIYNKLFGKEDLSAKREQIKRDQNIIACLKGDLQLMETLRARDGSSASRIETYRNVIIELEKRIEDQSFWLDTEKQVAPNTLRRDLNFAFSSKVSNLLALSKLALQTDSTRVITLSLDWIDGSITVLGATRGWHTLSHHGGRQDKLELLSRIEMDIVKQINQFLTELDEIKEGDGTLLDHTTVVIGSNFGDASNHTCNNLPIVIAGGHYRHQSHVIANKKTPLCNLWLELLHEHNIDVQTFGSSQPGKISCLVSKLTVDIQDPL